MKFERSLISVTIILLFLSLSILNVQCKVPSENEAFTMNNKITIRSYIEDVFAEETTVYCREHNNITIYDCSSPGEPIILGEYSSELELGSDFFVKEGYVYQIGSKYSQDLKIPEQKLSFQIIDSHKPTNPQLVGEWQMEVKDDYYFYGFIDETIVEGNIAYIISFKGHLEGGYFGELLMIDCSDLENPKLAGSYCDNYTVFHSLAVMGNLVCLLTYTDDTIDSSRKIEIIDVTNSSTPQKISELFVNRIISEIVVEENHLYLLDSDNGLEIYDMNNSTHPQKVGEYEISEGFDLFVDDQLAYILKSNGLVILDVSNFGQITKKGEYRSPKRERWDWFTDIFVSEKYAYLGKAAQYENRAFFILNCENPAQPKKLYPKGIAPLSLREASLLVISIFGGLILLGIIVALSVILYIHRKKKKQKVEQGEQ